MESPLELGWGVWGGTLAGKHRQDVLLGAASQGELGHTLCGSLFSRLEEEGAMRMCQAGCPLAGVQEGDVRMGSASADPVLG